MNTAKRFSKQRITVLNELSKLTTHPTADEIYEITKKTIPNISLGTVYRNLNNLCEEGAVLKFTIDGKEHFDANINPHIHLCCENCGEIKGYFVLSSAERANKLIELVNHPRFGICWDTGHANINGHQYDHIKALGNNLRALHINDNRGVDDEHMAPFFGTVNMDEIINALLDIDYKGYFTFECGYSLRPTDLYLGARRRFEKDTRLLHPTLEMQSDMTNFLYKMGRHILNAYNIFEE